MSQAFRLQGRAILWGLSIRVIGSRILKEGVQGLGLRISLLAVADIAPVLFVAAPSNKCS